MRNFYIFIILIFSICIANAAGQISCGKTEVKHSVKRGENLSYILKLFKIAKIYGKNGVIKNIANLNKIKNPNYIYPGQKLLIRPKCKVAAYQTPVVPKVVEPEPTIELTTPPEPEIINVVEDKAPEKIPLNIDWHTRLSLGINSINIKGTDNSGLESGKIASTVIPSVNLLAGFEIEKKWTTEFAYYYRTITASVPAGVLIDKNKSTLTNLKLEQGYFLKSDEDIKYKMILGIQRSDQPFMVGGGVVDINMLSLKLNSIVLGSQINLKHSEAWQSLYGLRLFKNVSSEISSGSMTVTEKLPFELSAQLKRKMKENLYFSGDFLYQSQNFDFDYKSGNSLRNGSYTFTDTGLLFGVEYQF